MLPAPWYPMRWSRAARRPRRSACHLGLSRVSPGGAHLRFPEPLREAAPAAATAAGANGPGDPRCVGARGQETVTEALASASETGEATGHGSPAVYCIWGEDETIEEDQVYDIGSEDEGGCQCAGGGTTAC